jgi:carboxypeptidase C (cathepsin A)
MSKKRSQTADLTDHPCFDPTPYGNGPTDSVTDATENAAITHHEIVLDGKTIAYQAIAGHLVTVDASTSQTAAKMFYVAFTAMDGENTSRPVTFFYNGGPGSSAVFVLLGSFAPRRIKTRLPGFTPPPYALEDNPDCLLDKSDLVYINPVGTGYSAAIAPNRNTDFWGVDQDAASIRQFIKRYLTIYDRWNSPKFLYGESYGTARSCVLAWLLHEDGIDLNGVVLQSSILDYSDVGNDPVGLLPTLAADAFYHGKVTSKPKPADLDSFLDQVVSFARKEYAAAVNIINLPKPMPDLSALLATIETLSAYTGIAPAVLITWGLGAGPGNNFGTLFLLALLHDEGRALGAYDGRVEGIDTGIAARINPLSGANDPTIAAINGVYTVMWNKFLNDELQFTATSAFTDLNDQAFQNWDFQHVDPTGAQKGGTDANGFQVLYTAGDLAATMALNVDLKVLSLNGYFDSVTPFFQTALDLENMPLLDAHLRKKNLTIKNYPSGHMTYLDPKSRTAMKADLARFFDSTTAKPVAMERSWSWLPPRTDGLPRSHRLRVFSALLGGPTSTIPVGKRQPRSGTRSPGHE